MPVGSKRRVYPGPTTHRPEALVLGKPKAQHRLFTAVRLSDIPRRPEAPVLGKLDNPAPPVHGGASFTIRAV